VTPREAPALLVSAAAAPLLVVLVSAAAGLAAYSPLDALYLVLREPGVLAPAGGLGEPYYVAHVGPTLLVIVKGVDMGCVANSVAVALAAALLATVAAVAAAGLAYLYSSARRVLAATLPVSMLSFPFVEAYVVKRLLSVDYGVPALLAGHGVPVVVVPRGLVGVAIYEAVAVAPYAVAVVFASSLSVPREEVEAAVQLGARGLRLLRLLASLVKPAIVTSLVFGAILVLDDVSGPIVFSDDPLARGLLSYRAYRYFISAATGEVDTRGLGYSLLLLLVSAPLIAAMLALYRRLGDVAAAAVPRGAPLRGGLAVAAAEALLMAPPLLVRSLSLLYAFTDEWLRSPLPRLGLEPWRQLLRHPDLLRAALNSAAYSLVVSLSALLLVASAAWVAGRAAGLASSLVSTLFTLPALLPGLVVAYGLYGAYAGRGGLLDPLRSPVPLLLLGYYTRRSPLLFHAALAASRAIPSSLYEAARGLGARPLRSYLATVAPLLAATLLPPLGYMALSVAGEVSLSVTIGGLGGAEGLHHPAPLMYLVASYMGYSGLKYAGVCAAATLAAYAAALAAVYAGSALYLALLRKSYR